MAFPALSQGLTGGKDACYDAVILTGGVNEMPENTSPETALQALQDLTISAQVLNGPLGIAVVGTGHKTTMVAALHEKGCATATEILVLLRNDLANGALARWRSLYEIELIASFLAIHDEEVAERYLNHAAIKNWEWLLSWQEGLKVMPVPAGAVPEMDDVSFIAHYKQKRDEAVGRYGKKFKYEYGWAADVVGTAKRTGPNRSDLEKALGRESMAPLYKSASYQVHPMANEVIAFAGRGTQDLALPGMMAASTLRDLTRTFVALGAPAELHPEVTERIDKLADAAIAAFSLLP